MYFDWYQTASEVLQPGDTLEGRLANQIALAAMLSPIGLLPVTYLTSSDEPSAEKSAAAPTKSES
jgi:hypothetical protein